MLVWPMAFPMPVLCSLCREPIADESPVKLVYDDLGRIDGVRHRACRLRAPKPVL